MDMKLMNAREYLISLYLDWRNNYLTYAKFAEDNGLTLAQAEMLISLANNAFHLKHPEE